MIVVDKELTAIEPHNRRRESGRSRGSAVDPTFSAIHDLGNLIQIASSGMNIMARDPNLIAAPSLQEVLNGARIALDRAGTLLRNAIASGDERPRGADRVDVASCLAEIERLVRTAWHSSVRFKILVSTGLPTLNCDYVALQSALLNLVLNARDSMPDGGLVSVEVVVDLKQAAAVEFRVKDTGIGMTQDTVVRAFEPFFTTKGHGLGGIGLPSVRRFAEEHGGTIDIQSALGSGTTAILRLPAGQ